MTPKSVLGRHLSGLDHQDRIHFDSIMDALMERREFGVVTLAIKYVAESLVQRQIEFMGYRKSRSRLMRDLELAKQFVRARVMTTAILLTRPVDLTYRDLPIQGRD